MHRSSVFLRRTLDTAIRRKFRAIRTHELQRKNTVVSENLGCGTDN